MAAIAALSIAALTPATSVRYARAASEQVSLRDRVAARLSDQTWRRLVGEGRGRTPETSTWDFYADGTFRWRFTSDVQTGNIGAWDIAAASPDRGVVFLAGRAPTAKTAPLRQALSFAFRDGMLMLGEASYQPVRSIDGDAPPRVPDDTRALVRPEKRDSSFGLWRTIAATQWVADPAVTAGEPTGYAFRSDGAYGAEFSSPPCRYAGTWSLVATEADRGEIRLSVPGNRCDARGAAPAIVREMRIELRDTTLLLHDTQYRSVHEGETK